MGNNVTIINSRFESLESKFKGGFGHIVANNMIIVKNTKLINIISMIGALFSIINNNKIVVQNISVNNSFSERYGAIIYSFSGNNFTIIESKFLYCLSSNLAGGFYLDIRNSLKIVASNFTNISAFDSGALINSVYENSISIEDSLIINLTLNQPNDGVIARIGKKINDRLFL